MSKIEFRTFIDMLTVATPSSGYAIGYDLDGTLKQKDQFGVISPIGATGSPGISSYTFSNGLTSSGSDIKLGGTLIEDTTIDGTYNLYIGITTPLSNIGFQTIGTNSQLSINNAGTGNDSYALSLDSISKSTTLVANIGGNTTSTVSLEIDRSIIAHQSQEIILASFTQSLQGLDTSVNNYMIIQDDFGLKGLVYLDDYTANFTENSLVTKQYVDSVSGLGTTPSLSQILTANNETGASDIIITSGQFIRSSTGSAYLSLDDSGQDTIRIDSLGTGIYIDSTTTQLYSSYIVYIDSPNVQLNTTNTFDIGCGNGGNGWNIQMMENSINATSSVNNKTFLFLNTSGSVFESGVVNSVIIGGQNIIATESNTVYLGNTVNINNAYRLPNTDGSTGYVLKTNGSGTVTWESPSILTIKITATPSEIQSLNSSPKQLIPAPGPGKFVEILAVEGYVSSGSGYTLNTNLSIKYSGSLDFIIYNQGLLLRDADPGIERFINAPSPNTVILEDTAIELTNFDGDPSGGDLGVDLYITYIIKTL